MSNQNPLKRFTRFLKIWDGVWSVPLAVFIFLMCGTAIAAAFGPEAGAMMPVYIQRLVYAATVLVIGNFVVWFGIYMNFRKVFDYYAKESGKDFKDLTKEQKIRMILILYLAYFVLFGLVLILV